MGLYIYEQGFGWLPEKLLENYYLHAFVEMKTFYYGDCCDEMCEDVRQLVEYYYNTTITLL